MAWIEPIFDRTIDDIYGLTEKAFLNYTDVNRIQGNIEYLRDMLQGLKDLKINDFSDKKIGDLIVQSEFENIVNAVNSLLEVVSNKKVSLTVANFEKINAIEKSINDLRGKIAEQVANLLYCDNMALIEHMGV